MKNPRPSNLVIRIFGSLLVLMAIFVLGAMIYHAFKGDKGDVGLGDPERELIN